MRRASISRRALTALLGLASLGSAQPAIGNVANAIHAQPAPSSGRGQVSSSAQSVRSMSELIGGPAGGSVVRGGMTIPRRKSQRQIRLARRRIAAHTNR